MGVKMQPESASTEPVVSPKAAPQPEVTRGAAIVQPVSPPPAKKNAWVNILVGLLIFLLVASAAGLGYWDYTLNNNLTSTKNQTTELQGKYEKLQSNNKQLTSDLAQAKIDLEKATGDLKKIQGDLTDVDLDAKVVKARITTTTKLMDVVIATFVSDEKLPDLDKKIKATDDNKLISLWETFKKSGKQDDLNKFYDYLFTSISANLTK